MGTTADEVQWQGWEPFYWLKIQGLPFYFFATIDPTESKYGSDAWTLPSGYTAKRGMDPPDSPITQRLKDLVGGRATAPSCSVELTDFDAYDSAGPYKFIGRLNAPGRAQNVAAVNWGTLDADLPASTGAGGTFKARGYQTFATSGDAYVGSETIGYSATAVASNVTTFTIAARNKYPCNAGWPKALPYRVFRDGNGQPVPSMASIVSSEPWGLIERPAALYVGHMRPSGVPETEANGTCLLLGRITSVKSKRGKFTLGIESILADLDQAKIAPRLGRATMGHSVDANGEIHIPAHLHYRTFVMGHHEADKGPANVRDSTVVRVETVVTIAAGTYNPHTLANAVNVAIMAVTTSPKLSDRERDKQRYCTVLVDDVDGKPHFVFRYTNPNLTEINTGLYLRHGMYSATNLPISWVRSGVSLLSAMGFPPDRGDFEAQSSAEVFGGNSDATTHVVVAPLPRPVVYFPTAGSGIANAVTIVGKDAPGSRFFTDQGDGLGEAWARLKDGKVVRLISKADNALTLGKQFDPIRAGLSYEEQDAYAYHYVPYPEEATIEQVVMTAGINQSSLPLLLGRYLASNQGATAVDDLNVFPEGVGLGWHAIMDLPSWRQTVPVSGARKFIVDKDTTFAELFDPIAKEHGLALVWSPESGKVTLRIIRIPNSRIAHTVAFNETNRADPNDDTDEEMDDANVRSGWTIQLGWDPIERKFKGPAHNLYEDFQINLAGTSSKVEKIEDKTLVGTQAAALILEQIRRRSALYRYVWTRCRRSLQKRAFFLSPATIHQVVDALLHNPFTGAEGITAADGVYCILTSVSVTPKTGLVTVEWYMNTTEPAPRFRPVAPVGLIDYNANTGGFSRGWKGTPDNQLKFVREYTRHTDASYKDGIDFLAGDKVRVYSRDNNGALTFNHADTLTAVATDGLTVTLTTGFVNLPTDTECILVGETYDQATSTQQGAGSYIGSSVNGQILVTAPNNRWG